MIISLSFMEPQDECRVEPRLKAKIKLAPLLFSFWVNDGENYAPRRIITERCTRVLFYVLTVNPRFILYIFSRVLYERVHVSLFISFCTLRSLCMHIFYELLSFSTFALWVTNYFHTVITSFIVIPIQKYIFGRE